MKTCVVGRFLQALRTCNSGTWLGGRCIAEDRSSEHVELGRGCWLGAGGAERSRHVPMQLSSIYIQDTQELTAARTLQGEKCYFTTNKDYIHCVMVKLGM